MSLELELNELSKLVPAFSAPIAEALNSSLPDPRIIRRMTYNQAAQDAAAEPFIPYMYWTGPANTDLGQHANGICGTKKEDFWFWFNHGSMTDAMIWAQSVRSTLMQKLVDEKSIVLRSLRITAAIFIDCHPIQKDMQTLLTSKEFPVSQSVLGFTFGYQSSGG